MSDQAYHWGRCAGNYEQEFIDPYRSDVRSPLLDAIQQLTGTGDRRAADLGCGTGPLLPWLAERFQRVHAVDFAEGMLDRARQRCTGLANVEFLQTRLSDLSAIAAGVDVAVAVNSLVMPDLDELEASLEQVRAIVRPGGCLVGIVPALDAVHYQTMLLVDRARATGMPPDKARQNAAYHTEHEAFDFAFGGYRYRGLELHFWQPFEVSYRLRRAGFRRVRLAKVWLSWKQFDHGEDLEDHPPPWDWFFRAEPDRTP